MTPTPPTPEERPAPTRKSSKARRRAALALALVALPLALRAALPSALEALLERQAGAALGRQVELEDVDLGLLAGSLVIHGLSVGEPPADAATTAPVAGPPLLTLERGAVELDWRALRTGRIHLRRLEIVAPRLRLERDEQGELTPIVAAAPPEPEPDEPDPDAGGGAWPVFIDRVALRDAGLDLVPAAGDESQLLAFSLARLDVSDILLSGGQVDLGDVAFVEPRLRVRRELALGGGGAEEPVGQAAGPGTPSSEPTSGSATPGETAAEPAQPATGRASGYHIRSLGVERAGFSLVGDDASLEVALSFSARDVGLGAQTRFPVELRLEIQEGSIETSGELGLAPPSFAGSVRWSELGFPLLLRTLVPDLPVGVASVVSSGDVRLEVLPAEGPEAPGSVTVTGRGALDGVELELDGARLLAGRIELEADPLRVPLAADGADAEPLRFAGRLRARGLDWKSAEDDGVSAVLESLEIGARELSIDPSGRAASRVRLSVVELAGPSLSLVRGAPRPAEPEDEAARPVALELSVAELRLRNGSLDFTDATPTPAFRTKLREVAVTARDLRWPAQTAGRVSLRAKGPGDSSIAVDGALGRRDGSLELALRAVALPPLNPYAESAGYRLKGGSASLEGALRQAGDAVSADTRLRLEDFDVEALDAADFSRRFGMSLDVALALLRDAAGRIELPIRLEAQRGALRTQLTPILVATLRQALIGAATIPLKTLQGTLQILTRNGRLDVKPLASEPGSAALAQSAETGAEIEALAQLLSVRPKLGLALHGSVGPADEPALAARSLAEQLRAGGELPELPDVESRTRRRIANALREHGPAAGAELDGEDAAALARYLEATPVGEEQRRELATARAQAVYEALVEGHRVEAARVRVSDPTSGESGVVLELVPARALARETSDAAPAVGAPPAP